MALLMHQGEGWRYAKSSGSSQSGAASGDAPTAGAGYGNWWTGRVAIRLPSGKKDQPPPRAAPKAGNRGGRPPGRFIVNSRGLIRAVPLTAGELYRAFDSDPQPIVDFLRWVAESHRYPDAPRVLDVGCGVGRLLAPLADLGWRVTAMEPDPSYRALAEATGRPLPGVDVVVGGFNDIEADRVFDLVVGINGAFAYLLDPDDRLDALARCHDALKPGGVLLLDLPNLLWILRNYRTPPEQVRQIGAMTVVLTRRHEIDYQAATFTTKEEYRAAGRGSTLLLQRDHVYAINTLPDLAFLLDDVGFDPPETFRSFSARSPEPLGEGRMLLLARRPPVPDD